MSTMQKALRKFAPLATLVLGSLAISACTTANVNEGSIYRPQPGGVLTASALATAAPGYSLEPQSITTADGVRLEGVLLRSPNAQKTILFFGGNGFVVERGAAVARLLAPLNVNIMMIDYRGYGASGAGDPTVTNLLSDSLAIFDHLATLPGMSPSNIIVHGHSLGSFMAGYVAANRATGGVVLQSSATTAQDFVRAQIPGLARPFVKIRIGESLQGQGNLQHMSTITEPMLVIVGAEDRVTPPSMSRELYQASTLAPACKRLALISEAGHNDVFQHAAAIDAYRQFLNNEGCVLQ